MPLQFGTDQINNPAPAWLKNLANGMSIAFVIVAAIISPMPVEWIPNEAKVYILSITSSAGILKVIEKLTGQTPAQQ